MTTTEIFLTISNEIEELEAKLQTIAILVGDGSVDNCPNEFFSDIRKNAEKAFESYPQEFCREISFENVSHNMFESLENLFKVAKGLDGSHGECVRGNDLIDESIETVGHLIKTISAQIMAIETMISSLREIGLPKVAV